MDAFATVDEYVWINGLITAADNEVKLARTIARIVDLSIEDVRSRSISRTTFCKFGSQSDLKLLSVGS